MKSYFFRYKKQLTFVLFMIVIQSVLSILIAFIFKNIIDSAEKFNLDLFKLNLFILLIVSILNYIFSFIVGVSESKLIKEIMIDLKNDLLKKIFYKDTGIKIKDNTGKYISNIMNDVPILESSYFYSNFNIFSSSINFIFAVVSLLLLNYIIGSIVLSLSIILALIPKIPKSKLGKLKDDYSKALMDLTTNVKDSLLGIETIKNFNSEKQFLQQLNKTIKFQEERKYKFNVFYTFINNTFSILGFMTFILTICVSSYLVIKKEISMGVMIASIQLINNVNSPIQLIISSINNLNSSKDIKNNIESILKESNNQENKLDNMVTFSDCILLKNISFSYENDIYIINNISLKIKKGDKITIIGTSGCGKSTLLKLISGFLKIKDGSITIDNNDIYSLSKKILCKIIGIISQDIFIFDTSLKNNITLYDEINKEKIKYWVNLIGLDPLFEKFDYDLNANVGENGNNISGGQKQQIGILRALIRNTPILILDEINSSLDNNLSYNIEDALLNIDDLTIISVTHKLNKNLLNRYDNILIMDEGKICEQGNFNELIDKKGYFYNLYKIQE